MPKNFNSRSSHFYTLNNHILQKVKQNPYLGILISEDLKWEPHLIKITKKANSTLAFLKRNLRHCPEPCRRTAYISLVRSVLEYGSIVWDPYYVKDINRIEKIQPQAVRFISGDYATREPGCISKMLKDQDLPSLQDRRMAARLTFFYKVVEGLVPAISPDAFLKESGSFRRRSSSPPRRFAPAAFRPRSYRPPSRFAPGRFAPRRKIYLFVEIYVNSLQYFMRVEM